MREICFFNKGDNIKKLCFKLGINDNIKVSNEYIFNSKYALIKEGKEDVQMVKNYNPYFISDNISITSLESKGYKVIGACGNKVVYCVPSGMKYSVKPLETIEYLSEKFGVDVDTIMHTNNLITTKLFVGQILYL